MVGTVPKPNKKIVEGSKIETLNTQIYDQSLSWIGRGTPIKNGGVNQLNWSKLHPCIVKLWGLYENYELIEREIHETV